MGDSFFSNYIKYTDKPDAARLALDLLISEYQSSGYLRFSHIRNRFLFAMRNNAPILAWPKLPTEVRNHTGEKRGSYKKKSTAGESEKGK